MLIIKDFTLHDFTYRFKFISDDVEINWNALQATGEHKEKYLTKNVTNFVNTKILTLVCIITDCISNHECVYSDWHYDIIFHITRCKRGGGGVYFNTNPISSTIIRVVGPIFEVSRDNSAYLDHKWKVPSYIVLYYNNNLTCTNR